MHQRYANTIRGINHYGCCHGNCDGCTVLSNMLFCTQTMTTEIDKKNDYRK